ncbi:MAG: response regulator [Planctomycetota bacterium]|jgi:DNA-binding response OmpR family regulator
MAKIILTEDDIPLQKVFTKWLTNEGHEVVAASNGQEGMRSLIFSEKPDLVITDLMMPEVDGEDLVGALDTIHDDVQILVVTACSDEEKLKRVREFPSVVKILSKPVSNEDLIREVSAVIDNAE